MRRLLYKDELYFYKTFETAPYCYTRFYLQVYVLRRGFWKFLSKYKKIGEDYEFSSFLDNEYRFNNILINIIEKSAYKSKRVKSNSIHTPPLIIECSEEITDLYRE